MPRAALAFRRLRRLRGQPRLGLPSPPSPESGVSEVSFPAAIKATASSRIQNTRAFPNMSAFEALFGSQLISKTGSVPTSEALAGKKHVMIYFSAHW